MPNNQNPWKKLSSEIVHKNPWYYVRKDQVIKPDGTKGEYDVVVTPPAVFVVPVDDDQNVYLIGQYRYTTDRYSIETVGGGSDGQDVSEAAKRELLEETGLKANSWKKLGEIQSANGVMNETCHVFLATGLEQTDNNEQLEEGIQEVIKVPLKDVFEMIKQGELTDSQSIAALTMAALELGIIE